MSLRSFTIFQDAPVADAPQQAQKTTRPSPVLTRSTSLTLVGANRADSAVDFIAVIDKENYHPVTGERAGSSATNTEKKRKTNVLATKIHATVVVTKKQKSSQPEAKKRKTSTSTKSKATSTKKDGKSLATGKKSGSKRAASRQVSPLPKVDEEGEAEKECERLSQAAIDSRCYELTVKPLADVSQAYEEAASGNELICDGKGPFRTIKESSAEPELRDYFSPTPSVASLCSSHLGRLTEHNEETHTFSTPERKQIYAAFTFSTPSPTSKRFREAEASRSRTASPLGHASAS